MIPLPLFLLALASGATFLAIYIWRRYVLLHYFSLTTLLLIALTTLITAWLELLLPDVATTFGWSLLSLLAGGSLLLIGIAKRQQFILASLAPVVTLQNMDDPVLVVTSDDRVVQANTAAAHLTGLSLKQMVGQSVAELPVLGRYCQALPAEPIHLNNCWYDVGQTPLHNGRSQPLGHLFLFRDITNYYELNAEKEAALKAFPDLTFYLDKQGVFLKYWLGRGVPLFTPPDNFLGRSVHEVFPPSLADKFYTAVQQVSARDGVATDVATDVAADAAADAASDVVTDVVTVEYQLPGEFGEQYYEARLTAIQGGQIVAMVRDVTERQRAHRKGTALAALSQLLTPITTPVEAARVIAAVAQQLIGWDRFSFCLYQPTSNQYETVLTLIYQGKKLVEPPDLATEIRDRLYNLRQQAVKHGAYRADGPEQAMQALAVPIQHGETVLGAIAIEHDWENPYTAAHLNTLQALAHHVSGALQRIQAELRLAESQALYQHILETVQEGICVTNRAGELMFVNPFLADLLGYDVQEMIGRPLTDFANDPQITQFTQKLATASGPITEQSDSKLPTKRGTTIWVTMKSQILATEDRDSASAIITIIDITERKEIENVLATNAANLHEAHQIARMGRWELDLTSNILYWSSGIFELFEVDPDEFEASYEAFLSFIHPDDRAWVDRAYQASVANNSRYEIAHRVQLANGRIKWVNEIGETEYDADGRPLRSVGTVQDITSIKAAEEALRQSQEQTQAVIDSLSAHICVLNETGTITAVNKAWRDYAEANGGDPHRTGVGNNYLDTCRPLPGQRQGFMYDLYHGICSVIEGERDLFEIEYPCHSPTRPGWFMQRITPLISDRLSDGLRRTVVAHEDITERKLAELALQEQNRQLSTLYETAVGLLNQLDVDDLLQFAANQAHRLLDAGKTAVLIYEKDRFVVRAAAGPKFLTVGQSLTPEEAPLAWQVCTQQLTRKIDQRALFPPESAVLQHPALKTVLMMPIVIGPNCLGVLVIGRTRPGKPFRPSCLQIGELLVQLLSLALENARLHTTMKANLTELSVLYNVSQLTSRSLDIDQVLEAAITALDFKGGFLVLHDNDRGSYLASTRHLPTELETFFYQQESIGNLCLPVTKQGQPLIITDPWQVTDSETGQTIAPALQASQVDTFVAVPLQQHDQSIGVLGLVNQVTATKIPLKRDLLDTVGYQTAVSVANARLHQVISEQHNRLATIIDASRDGILLIDMARRVQVINQAALVLLGLSGDPESWQGRRMRDLLTEIGRRNSTMMHNLIAEIKRVKDGHAPAASGKEDMPPYIVEWHNLPVSQPNNAAIRLFILRDITEQEQAIQLRHDLTQTMVHDLRNPLTAIRGAAELLTLDWHDVFPDEPPTMLHIIEQNSTKMMNLVNTIMDITRLETHALAIQPEPIILHDVVTEQLTLQKPLAQKQQIKIQNLVPPTLPVIDADVRLLTRTLQNLIDNALKFTPAGGSVYVTADHVVCNGEEMLQVTVCDSGPGIADELFPQLFQKFVTGKHERRGSGLGLAFCRLVIEAHDGKIWAENGGDGGAVFRFSLPYLNGR